MEYIEITSSNIDKCLADIKFHLYHIWDQLEAINTKALYEVAFYLYEELPPDIDSPESERESIITLLDYETQEHVDIAKCLKGIFAEDVSGNQIMMNDHLLELSKYVRGEPLQTITISRPTAHELAELCQKRNSSSQ